MTIIREPVYEALFALGGALTWPGGGAFVGTSRRVKTPDRVIGSTPYLCQGEYSESTTQQTRLPQLRVWRAAWFIYLFNGDDEAVIYQQLNPILDAIDALFPADPELEVQTLGGLVNKVWVDGETRKYGGNIDGTLLCVVPLSISCP